MAIFKAEEGLKLSFFSFTKYKLDLSKKIYVMGILNLTPDSFSDGGKYSSAEKALKRAIEIEAEGADIIDIGAQSTRPGFSTVSELEEWQRLEKPLKLIRHNLKIPISIDTFYPSVARKAIECGADIINDITGFENAEMFEVLKQSNCGLIINHNYGDLNIKNFFEKKLIEAEKLKIPKNRICFDPGIGFNKTRSQDAFIINNLKNLKTENNSLLIGVSNKRIVRKNITDFNSPEMLAANITINIISILNGTNIIRVHDVKEHVQAIKTLHYIKKLI